VGVTDDEVRELVGRLLDISLDTAERDELARATALNATLKSFCSRVDMRIARRGTELHGQGSCESGMSMLLDNGNGSERDARAAIDRSRACNAIPGFDAALDAGEVSGEHLDVLARHTRQLNDQERSELAAEADELVRSATSGTTSMFERSLKERINSIKARSNPNADVDLLERQRAQSKIVRRTDPVTGMKTTVVDLDPLRDSTAHNVIAAHLARLRQDPATKDLPFAQLQVMAFMNAITGRTSGSSGDSSADSSDGSVESDESGSTIGVGVPEVIVHMDARTSCEGRHADTMCETQDGDPIPVATAQRLCCEAAITMVIVEADGTVRRLVEERTANRRQRRALAAMYATCAHPDCRVPFSQCRIHHIVWWSKGGPTVLDNLVPLCSQHHHQVHEGGWNLSMTPDRTLTWLRPDGNVWRTHRSMNRRIPSGDDRRRRPANAA
jgi:hypothetical protein